MIVDWLLNALYAVISPVVDALPSASPPDVATNAAQWFIDALAAVDTFVPVRDPLLFLMGAVSTTFAGLLAYRVGLFIYNRIRG